MADTPKAAWPKTPDGTTDWQYVFEDPSAGFIPLLSQAKTDVSLEMIATVILQKLFTRKNDIEVLNLHLARLKTIIQSGGSIEGQIRQVTNLMRDVKDERIEKARVYIERKRAGASIDRRSGMFWKLDNLLKPSILVPLVVVLVLVLSGLIYMMLGATTGQDRVVSVNPTHEQSTSQQPGEQTSPSQSAEPQQKAEKKPIPVMFKTLRWPLATQFTTDRPQYYSVVLYVKTFDQKVEICRRLPAVMDRFYTSFSDSMPANRPARTEEMHALEKEIVSGINALMNDTYVSDASVGRYGTHEFRIAPRPPYCWTPN